MLFRSPAHRASGSFPACRVHCSICTPPSRRILERVPSVPGRLGKWRGKYCACPLPVSCTFAKAPCNNGLRRLPIAAPLYTGLRPSISAVWRRLPPGPHEPSLSISAPAHGFRLSRHERRFAGPVVESCRRSIHSEASCFARLPNRFFSIPSSTIQN